MTGFGSDSSTASMRARWLLTLSAFGVACGQTPAGNDAMVSDVTSSDQSMVDATTSDTGVVTDSGVSMDSGVETDSGVVSDGGVASDSRVPTDVGALDATIGNMEGQILEDLQLQGYINTEGTQLSTALPFGPTSLRELQRTGRRYALVHSSATF